MTYKSVRDRSRLGLVLWLAAALALPIAASPARAASQIVVHLDQARIIKLPERAVTVVIGNPLIADLTLQHNGLAVITGKGYGATNVVVLDKDGGVLAEHDIEVQGPTDPTVVVYRGVDRETYSCTPDCSRRITLGDMPDFFEKTMTETTSRNTQAIGAAASQQH
ncbi:MAG: pilus assembly protein N-terminal domain-containing protein [Xanthobacteraceae bacterium]